MENYSNSPKTFIYTSPILKNMYTEHPMMKFHNDTYVLLDAIKNCLSEEGYKKLRLKLRGYRRENDENKI
jgi:hypothetical protein